MRTLDSQRTPDYSLWGRARRNARLLWQIGRVLYAYLVVGRHIRRAYSEKAALGETYFVDEELRS